MKIGIFGGAFDPVHNGHIGIAQYILNQGIVEKVYLMPCYKSMFGKKMTAPRHRLKMIKIAVNPYPNIEALDFELKYQLTGDTYSIMYRLRNHFRKDLLYFIVGQDNANKIDLWGHHEQIIQEQPFIIIPRPGYPIFDNPWYEKEPHIKLKDAGYDHPISSTIIRKNLEKGKFHQELDPKVFRYIQEFELYLPNWKRTYL